MLHSVPSLLHFHTRRMAAGHSPSLCAMLPAAGWQNNKGFALPGSEVSKHFKGERERPTAQVDKFSEKGIVSIASLQLENCPCGAGRELGAQAGCAEPPAARHARDAILQALSWNINLVFPSV